MSVKSSTSIIHHFANLTDFRVERTRKHELLDIVVIAICGVIAGAESWEDVKLFATAKEKWLRTFLPLPNGIPSHDTIYRVFRHLDPDSLQKCVIGWMQAVAESLSLEQVAIQAEQPEAAQQPEVQGQPEAARQSKPRKHRAIDGKTLRRSIDRAGAKSALHLVSAWATEAELTLGQVAVDSKSNEITAIPKLLQLLDLKGALVTMDAMGCQKNIVADIVDGGADYVIAVKDNQPHLLEDIQECFRKELAEPVPAPAAPAVLEVAAPVVPEAPVPAVPEAPVPGAKAAEAATVHTVDRTEEKGHGRTEIREVHTIVNPKGIRNAALWKGLLAICMVVSTRHHCRCRKRGTTLLHRQPECRGQ